MMKKLISLLLAAVMLLSLCACGGGNTPPANNSASTPAPEETETLLETEAPLETEALLETATDFDFDAFCSVAESNELRAKDTYEGNAYIISAFVREITETNCMLAFFDTYDDDYRMRVQFDKEILMELETYQRITIVGRIDEISGQIIDIKEAEYLDSTAELSATVLSIIYASVSDEKPSYCIARVSGFVDGIVGPLCLVRLSGDELATLNEEDEISVKGTLYTLTYNHTQIYSHNGKTVPLELKNAELVG